MIKTGDKRMRAVEEIKKPNSRLTNLLYSIVKKNVNNMKHSTSKLKNNQMLSNKKIQLLSVL